MATELKRGTYAIIDETDAPCPSCVVRLTSFDRRRKVWRAQYLYKGRNHHGPYGARPTALADFGRAVEIKGDTFRVVKTNTSPIATYSDGETRHWQGRSVTEWLPLRKPARSAQEADG